jgi:hypothetical protein
LAQAVAIAAPGKAGRCEVTERICAGVAINRGVVRAAAAE